MDTHIAGKTWRNRSKRKTAATDQTFALSIGKTVGLHPIATETPLVGCPALSLWLSIDTPDIDLGATYAKSSPTALVSLWSDLRRLRYRESLRDAKLVKSGRSCAVI